MSLVYTRDIHILKYFSSFVSISDGKIINITEPTLMSCPLANHLYKNFKTKRNNDKKTIKIAIKNAIESKIKDYGFFTKKRKLSYDAISIPYGASEMLMFALKKNAIDAAVVVCEGAGTIITNLPEVVQGVGARMNTLLLTSPIKEIIKKLKTLGCRVIFENALIDQARGVKEAIEAGYRTIAVTVSGHSADHLKTFRLLERKEGIKIISLAVCTTGIDKNNVALIRDYADLVWSCASFDVRNIIGPVAKCQLSTQIPVFVLTKSGVDFVSAYAAESKLVESLNLKKQYLFSSKLGGQRIHLGNFTVFIHEAKLPVNARNMPSFKDRK